MGKRACAQASNAGRAGFQVSKQIDESSLVSGIIPDQILFPFSDKKRKTDSWIRSAGLAVSSSYSLLK